MIKNERQYSITKKQADRFVQALESLQRTGSADTSTQPLLRDLQERALRSQITDLRAELKEYEDIKAGVRPVLHLDSFEEIPAALISARIAANMTQQDLAERLGMKEQQIQRYEASDYAGASLATLTAVVHALGVGIREDVLLPTHQVSSQSFFRRLRTLGLDRVFVTQRLLSPTLRAQMDVTGNSNVSASPLLQAAAAVGRVFGFDPTSIFADTSLQLNTEVVGAARFKTGASVNETRLAAYAIYAHFLAERVLEATRELPRLPVPTDPQEVRTAIIATYGTVDFVSTLRYVWDLGIPVLPLNDSGAFHGAIWREEGRNVIVLKQRTHSDARWLIDLLHELRHAGEAPDTSTLTVIEESETAQSRRTSPEERNATRFAGNVALAGQADALVRLCVKEASNVERLKAVLPRVAQREGVSVGVLANYLAFRLGQEDPPVDWWGAATNLQETGSDPWRVARDVLLERLDFGHLSRPDRDLLIQALTDPE